MITRLVVRNFQAIKHADLDLGVFTVIVGPSSSGKSALIRAVHALASNVRGTAAITRGQKQMAITATLDNGTMVTLERSDRASSYQLTGDGTQQFTKLAGEVPPHISDTLRLDPGPGSVNFAGQFDKPFLLAESGAVVARELAELTNVNQIFEAVRSANRIRTATQSTLKLRSTDMEAVTTGLRAFQGLSDQLKAFTVVQTLDERRKALEGRVNRLDKAIRDLTTLQDALTGYQPITLPDGQHLDDLKTRYLTLRNAAMTVVTRTTQARNAEQQAQDADLYLTSMQEALRKLLAEAKICPTCGQSLRPA